MISRRRFLEHCGLMALPPLGSRFAIATAQAQQVARYQSPYRLRLTNSEKSLEVGFDLPPWNNPHEESAIPPAEWYSRELRRKYGAWGPPARHYPAHPEVRNQNGRWLAERVILSASRWISYPYQHHHVPDWNPPREWPWHRVAYGRNSKGIDCSNFSSFYYNYALGIKLDTGIRQQAERTTMRGPGGRGVLEIERILRSNYDTLIKTLQPADLLYIRNNSGRVAHVILWLGDLCDSPDGTPLILDSTGSGHVDSSGQEIPIGVHIRPFGPQSWYAKDFSHAHRIIHHLDKVREGHAPEPQEGGAVEF